MLLVKPTCVVCQCGCTPKIANCCTENLNLEMDQAALTGILFHWTPSNFQVVLLEVSLPLPLLLSEAIIRSGHGALCNSHVGLGLVFWLALVLCLLSRAPGPVYTEPLTIGASQSCHEALLMQRWLAGSPV